MRTDFQSGRATVRQGETLRRVNERREVFICALITQTILDRHPTHLTRTICYNLQAMQGSSTKKSLTIHGKKKNITRGLFAYKFITICSYAH